MSSEPVFVESIASSAKNSIVGGPFGSNLVSKDYVPEGVPVIRGQNMGNKWVGGEFVFVSEDKASSLEPNKARPGDLIFTQRGTLGQVAIVPDTPYPEYIVSQSQMKLSVDPQKADVGYLYYAFLGPEQQEYIRNNAIQTGVPHTNLGILKKTPITLPLLAEQQKIAGLLGALDDRIALLRETNATLEAIAQALFKSWFVDFDPVHARTRGEEPVGLSSEVAALFPDSFEESELGMVPKGWKIGTLASVANFQNGYAFKSKDWRETGHPVVKIGDVKPGIIDFSGCSYIDPETTEGLSRFKLERGDLLVGMTGYVGETGLVPHVKPHAYLNQRVGRIATRSGLADLGFVYCLVRNPAFKGYAEAHSHGSAQANVSGAVLLDYATFIPTKDLLNHFNGVVGEMLESILSNHEQAQTLATLRDTLLPRLISGQLRLPEAEAQLSEAGLCQ
ncbi:restriction endonuclease subunit S [Aeromonas rivipollensis]|uniref:restriction endonuclease subunit S n=1 Tax=Aeromonas rivipollensis TaxID=948519 RepID=UPI003D1EC7F4